MLCYRESAPLLGVPFCEHNLMTFYVYSSTHVRRPAATFTGRIPEMYAE